MIDTIKLDNIRANLEVVENETLLQILPNQNGKVLLDWGKGNIQSLTLELRLKS